MIFEPIEIVKNTFDVFQSRLFTGEISSHNVKKIHRLRFILQALIWVCVKESIIRLIVIFLNWVLIVHVNCTI